jgi:hypothetical protein
MLARAHVLGNHRELRDHATRDHEQRTQVLTRRREP